MQETQRKPADTRPLRDTPIRYARSDGGVTNNQLNQVEETWGEFVDRFTGDPSIGPKDGSYFVRGPLKEGVTERANDNLAHSELLILDGDSRFDPSTGEIREGAPAPRATHQALCDAGIPHVLYTSYSHGSPEKGNRYRVVIPTQPMEMRAVPVAAQQLCETLAAHGVNLVNVKENGTMAQPWYQPRRAYETQEYLCLVHEEGELLPAPEAIAESDNTKLTNGTLSPPARTVTSRDPHSVPGQFNAHHKGAGPILDLLRAHDYRLRGVGETNGAPSYRLVCPGSTSGHAGTVVFLCEDSTYRVYSHHGSDLLNAGTAEPRAHDYYSLYCALEHGGDHGAAAEAARRHVDERPVIKQSDGRLHIHVHEAVAQLAAQDPAQCFQRGATLVRIAHSDVKTTQDDIQIPAGTASIVPFKATTMELLLSRIVAWEKWVNRGGWVPADPNSRVVATLLDAYGYWQGIPHLRGISEAPILRDDGALICGPAYDTDTQLYVEGQVTGLVIPDSVGLDDAKAAAERILAVFSEFPFEDPDLDQSVVLAYLLTLLLRPGLPTAPLFGVSATAPGTGKGLLVEVCNLIVRGVDAALMPPVSGKESEEEMRKRITAFVSQGLTSLNLDNYSRPIGGDSLNALLTTTEWTDRVLGTSNTVKLPVCCTLAATGNNLTVRGDMVRRSLLIMLDARVEHPERRPFTVRNLARSVLEDRAELLGALFTILKAYRRSRCTDFDQDTLGRFEEWSRRVCHPIRWLGYPDPVDSQRRLQASDPEKEHLETLLRAWHAFLGDDWKQPSELISAASIATDFGPQHDDSLRTAFEEALHAVASERGNLDSRRLGWYLSRNHGRIIAGRRLERADRRHLKGKHAHRYRVVVTDSLPTSDTASNSSEDVPPSNDDLDFDIY